MRVIATKLRSAGRLLPGNERREFEADMRTTRFNTDERSFTVLELQQISHAPGQHLLHDPKVKHCEGNTMVFTGIEVEDGAWVSQEWEVEVSPMRILPRQAHRS